MNSVTQQYDANQFHFILNSCTEMENIYVQLLGPACT